MRLLLALSFVLTLGCDDPPRRVGGGNHGRGEPNASMSAMASDSSRDELGAIVDDLEDDPLEGEPDLMHGDLEHADEHELEAACMGGRQEACDLLGH